MRSKNAIGLRGIALAAVLAGSFAVTLAAARPEPPVYATWEGIGPDKWSSVWLISRHVAPTADIRFVPVNGDIGDAIGFDIPGSRFTREGRITTYEKLLAEVTDANTSERRTLERIGAIINEMEVSRWTVAATSEAGLVEDGFRGLQLALGREAVSFGCYMAFFDRVAAALRAAGEAPLEPGTLDMPTEVCAGGGAAPDMPSVVMELPAETVLTRIGRGERVVFVDTREESEFAEFHIPGAVNIPLREVGAETVSAVRDADLVIPYCVKDFRGYEVARAFADHGVDQVAVMNPYGIRGWRSVGLPVAGQWALSEEEALAELARCGADPEACLP